MVVIICEPQALNKYPLWTDRFCVQPHHVSLPQASQRSTSGEAPIAFQHSRITVQQDGRCTLDYGKRRKPGIYTSLGALVLDKRSLQTLHPSFEKERAFESQSNQ